MAEVKVLKVHGVDSWIRRWANLRGISPETVKAVE